MKDKLNRLDAVLNELQMDEYLNEDSLPKIGKARGLVNELVKNCSIPDVVGQSEQCCDVCDGYGYTVDVYGRRDKECEHCK
jgi:hypothetical protein